MAQDWRFGLGMGNWPDEGRFPVKAHKSGQRNF
jgi:hypothetical protein